MKESSAQDAIINVLREQFSSSSSLIYDSETTDERLMMTSTVDNDY